MHEWRVSGFDGLVGPTGLAVDADEQAPVDEPVSDGGSGCGIGEELAPVLEGQVGGDDGRTALIPSIEHLVEQIGAARVEGKVAKLVDEEQVVRPPGREGAREGVASLSSDERV